MYKFWAVLYMKNRKGKRLTLGLTDVMVFHLHIPSFPLNQFVESFIYYKNYQPEHSIDRFLPDGNINLVIDLKEEPQYIYDNHTLKEIQACKKVWFSGIRNHFITIPSGRDSEMFIVNFLKGKAYSFARTPLYELTDHVVDGELVLTSQILELRELLLEEPDPFKKFAIAEKNFLHAFGKYFEENPFIHYAVQQIIAAPDITSIDSICRKVGYSQKHMIHMFKKHVGLTPKSFLKVIRFQKVIEEIERKNPIHWSRLAIDTGYYDQAHFISDFKNFSGFTPKEYMLMKNHMLNYVPVK